MAEVCLSENETMNHKYIIHQVSVGLANFYWNKTDLQKKKHIIYSAQDDSELFLTDIYLFLCDEQMSEPQSLLFLIMKLVSDRQTS